MTLSWVETLRDWVIIVWGVISIVMFLTIILFLLSLWRGIRGLIGNIRLVVNEDVRPMLATGRESVNNITGTARFLSDTVVSPVIRIYGIVSGVRRGIGVFARLTGRGRRA